MSRRLNLFLSVIFLLPGAVLAAPAADSVANGTGNVFFDVVAENFAAWDADHDGTLSARELDGAIVNPSITGKPAAALATLWEAGFLGKDQPYTLPNIRKLATDKKVKTWAMYNRALIQLKQATNRVVFGSGLPQLGTIHQGRINNCYCLAPLGAMVYRDSHEVASWFETESNGNMLVKMPAGAISVPLPTDAELAFASGNSEDGIWVDLYEKAIAEARNERKPEAERYTLALEAIASAGEEEPILSYITGHKVRVVQLAFHGNDAAVATEMAHLRERLTFATTNKLLMVAATYHPSAPGLTPEHAYALLGYDSASDAVKLWNPHGDDFKPKGEAGTTNGYTMTNGVFSMPVADLTKQFARVLFERPETTPLKWSDQWELMAEAGHFAEAATNLAAVIDADESEDWKMYVLTPLLIQSGRVADYTNHCKSMLDQFEKTSNPSIAERTAKSCLLLPDAVGAEDFVRATNLAARAVSLSPHGAWLHWRLMTRGLAEYRAGCYDAAVATEAQAQKVAIRAPDMNGPACEADTWFVSAMAKEKLGKKRGARDDLKNGLKIVQTRLPKLDDPDMGPRWFDTLMANIVMREAEGNVKGQMASDK